MPDPFPKPLREIHQRAQAEFQPYASLEIVSTFGLPQSEYAAIRKSTGLMDLPQRGLLELTGRDRLPFLNNLLTNLTWNKQDKSGLAAGSSIYSFLLNAKGRIVADMNIVELGDRTLLEMDIRLVETVRSILDRYLFGEQVKIISRVGDLYRLALHGPGAADVLKDFNIDAILFRDDSCGVPGHQIIVPLARAVDLWNALTQPFVTVPEPGKRPLRPIGWAAFNACRIEAGTPLFDIDFGNSADPDQSTLPAETGPLFDRAVSLTKGCYLGQEIVARMHARQQLARKLCGLRMTTDALPIAGSPIFDEAHNPIGIITSSTLSPIRSGAAIALGSLKRPFFEIGTRVTIPAEGAMHIAEVVPLPFVKP